MKNQMVDNRIRPQTETPRTRVATFPTFELLKIENYLDAKLRENYKIIHISTFSLIEKENIPYTHIIVAKNVNTK